MSPLKNYLLENKQHLRAPDFLRLFVFFAHFSSLMVFTLAYVNQENDDLWVECSYALSWYFLFASDKLNIPSAASC